MKYPVLSYPILALFIGTVFAQGATFTVLNTNDTGAGSLRQAIADANANAGPDVIAFNIATGGLAIFPASALPVVSESATIDGTTQPGFAGAPLIELAGASAGAGVNGLHISAGSSTVRGLVINRFTASGLRLSTNGNNFVEGCLIGTGVGGTNDLGNTVDGIVITNCANNVIGGTTTAARNVISGNNQNGVHILGLASSNNVVVGNLIGLSLSNADLGNTGDGVRLAAPRNRIGGTTAAERNTISGNNSDGIELAGTNALNNVIQGNHVGTDTTGTIDRGNSGDGVLVSGAPGNSIGGTAPGAGNLLSGNDDGVELNGLNAAFNLVLGNRIGTDISGTLPLANGVNGVLVTANARTNTIGGVSAAEANTIAFNAGDGVNVTTGTNNAVRGNLIRANGNLGIDLGANGVQTNDVNDADAGPNQLQNYPLLATATGNAGSVQITGTFTSRASVSYLIDFYANYACDPSTNGEGQQYLGSTSVSTDAGGNANISATVSTPLAGRYVTATATDPDGNTSEFSPCVQATSLVPGNNFVVTTTNNAGAGSLREAILAANAAITAGDTITFNIPGGGVQIITPTNALPLITDPVTIDGYTQPGSATNSSPTIFNGLPLVRLDGALAGSGVDGLRITAGGSTIRGLVITRFTSDAIEIVTNGNNIIEGCLLGIDTTNTNRPNSAAGVHIVGTPANRVGGTTAGARNVISGNSGIGVHLENLGASNNIIVGNLVGSDLTGTIDRGNGNDGVQIDDAPNNIVGGPTAAERNVISGNNGDGVELFTAGAVGNQVLGNFIGTDAVGASAVANSGYGVYLTSNARNTTIGSPAAGAGNRIAFNGNDGVFISAGTNNSIRGNAIFANGTVATELGIDIGVNGITANDTGDGDTGANQLQNFPQLTGVTNTPGGVTFAGTLDSKTNTSFALDFYSNLACDTAGNGEGATYLGSSVVTTDGGGSVGFVVTLPGATLVGRYVTATATDPFGNTSEFSPCAFAASTAPPQTFTVVNTNNNGAGSLRAAIETNNARVSSGPNTISFNIPGAGPHRIATLTALPQIIESVVIDGYTQPGATANTSISGHNAGIRIILSGANAPGNTDGLELFAGNCVVRGLSIVGFGGANGDGVFISGGTGSRVEGCLIGLEPDGSARRGNGGYGVHITPSGTVIETGFHTIGGLVPAQRNVISANRFGIYINGSGTNLIAGNLVGTDATGAQSRGNTNGGVYVTGAESSGNQIGGSGATYRNVISGNDSSFNNAGLTLESCTGTLVAGNFIGADATGTNALANDLAGVRLRNASTNVIGGTSADSANVISGNEGTGLVIDGTASGNRIEGNLIGVTVTGLRALRNTEEGIDINGGSGNVIGGLVPGAGNVISANGVQGMEIFSSSLVGTFVQGNFIGTDRSGALALGNAGSGLQVSSSRHRIEANVIAFNQAAGVYISSGVGNLVTANSVHGNTGLGIDLGFFGVQANDAGDPDNGANGFQNYPVLSEALRGLASTIVSGSLNSIPNQAFRLEFFDNTECDPLNIYGEGRTYLGFLNVNTDASGNAAFSYVHPSLLAAGHFITATATDTNNSTSEFSRCLKVIPFDSVDLAVTMNASPDPAPLASNLVYAVTVRNNGPTNATGVVVTNVLPAGVNFISATATQGSCSHTGGVVTCNLGGIARGATSGITITVRPTVFGQLVSLVGVTSPQFDHTPENNSAIKLTQAGVADMAVALSATPNPVTAGRTLTYTVTAINLGPDPAPAAVAYFSIDEAFCPQSATASQGTVIRDENTFTAAIGALPVNGSATLTITGVAEVDGPLFSSASAGGGVSDPDFANNSAGDTTTVLPGAGMLRFDLTNLTRRENGGAISVAVIRTGGANGALTVQYTTTNGTALAGSDYSVASGTLNFANGETFKTFAVSLINNTIPECNETLGLGLFNATGGGGGTVLCADIEATLTIVDDDTVYSGAVLLVSANTNQPPDSGDDFSRGASISADGRYVAFESAAGDLVPGDDNFTTDVFVRDVAAGTTRLISSDEFLFEGFAPQISGNGSNIAFSSTPGFGQGLFVHLGALQTNQAVSVTPGGGLASGSSYDPSISSNGNVIVFTSSGNDLVTLPDNNFTLDVFARDLAAQTTVLVSVNEAGNRSGNSQSSTAKVSADGRYVAFVSDASDLVANDTNNAADIFLRDLQAGTTTLVSRSRVRPGSANSDSDGPVISADGRYVAFSSEATDLYPGDTNFTRDVFLFDRVTGTNQLVSVNRFGLGSGSEESFAPSISANGRYVAFESLAADLVANDFNGEITDIFVRDTVAGTTVLASADCAGQRSGNDHSTMPTIAGNGRSVVFFSRASDLVSGDFGERDSGEAFVAAGQIPSGGEYQQLYRRDLTTNRTELLSRNLNLTGGADGDSYDAAISFLGTTVVFASYADNLVNIDNNFESDVFAWSSSTTPPEPVPALTITRQGANQIVLSWPSPSTGFNLESTDDLNSPIDWAPVNAAVTDNGLTKTVTLLIDTNITARFFRLRK